jgi:DNA repair exonuclease SbcCD ATPase subunit
MITFKTISWKNFLSTGNAENKVILNRSTTTLIVGKNGDGKSTILDALCFSLFGKPFRNINKPQLINSINQKNCVVEIEFDIGKTEYRIVRGIKPNVFEIYQDNVLMNQDAAAKDYQKVLEQQILKLNYKTFTQVVILGSASFVPFMQLPSATRREVIEDILDIRVFSTMNTILKQKMQETKDEIAATESKLTLARERVDNQQKTIKILLDNRKEVVSSLQAKIDNNDVSIKATNETIEVLTQDINSLKQSIADRTEILSQIEKAKTIANKKTNKIADLTETVEFFNGNEVCPQCDQGIPHEHKTRIIEEIQRDYEENMKHIEDITAALGKLEERLEQINTVQNLISDKNIEVSTANQSITFLNTMNQQLMREITETQEDKSNVTEEKVKLKEMAQEAITLLDRKNTLSTDRYYQEVASNLLRDTGIKTKIIREYLPTMNKLINKYLQSMEFFVHFELDEVFNEIIKSRHRDAFTYASFSEGEKMRIDLAILFTWRQIAKMKNSVNTNLLILDEIFDSSLDVAGTDYFLTLMDAFGENTNVFVISHKGDQLFDKFRSVIKFQKQNDFSVIV